MATDGAWGVTAIEERVASVTFNFAVPETPETVAVIVARPAVVALVAKPSVSTVAIAESLVDQEAVAVRS